ncbi:MAG: hypothetical protein ACLQGT_12655 [Terracidiphilus sp.]
MLHSSFPFRQASVPARALEPIIRMEGLGAAMHWIDGTFALAAEVCMTLIEVKQRSKGRVKNSVWLRSSPALRTALSMPKSQPRPLSREYFFKNILGCWM